MKHLNEFEEFDPSDFEDFGQDQKDLKGLGFENPIPGKDYGFGPDLSGKNDGKTPLYLKPDSVKFLDKKGVIDSRFFLPNINWTGLTKLKEEMEHSMWMKFDGIDIRKLTSSDLDKYYKVPPNPDGEIRYVMVKNVSLGRSFPYGSYRYQKPYGINKECVKEVYDFITRILKGEVL